MKCWIVLLIVIAGANITGKAFDFGQKGADEMEYVQNFDQLEAKRAASKDAYMSFLNVDSMHCGIYSLPAGSADGQQPHTEDEVYYVQIGKAKIRIGEKDYDVQPGSIIFVPAYAEHRFHSITEDLKLLVFFSKVKIDKSEQQSKKSR